MDINQYDVVVVGARCAGASVATRLAAKGLKVVVLDAAKIPSDQPLSTHYIHPPGMDQLDALGVGERVRSLAPAIRGMRIDHDGLQVVSTYESGRTGRCLRRDKLDPLLIEAAIKAGAELRDSCRVTELIRENGRVAGVVVLGRKGARESIRGRFVIGADGRKSTVARLVGAEEYHSATLPRFSYWAYWPMPRGWHPDMFYLGRHGPDLHFATPTNDDLLILTTAPPLERLGQWRDHRASYLADIRAFPPVADVIAGLEPASRIIGMRRLQTLLRRSAGPGWALVGDAGCLLDPTTGYGITHALQHGQMLSDAILDGSDAALDHYWRKRDVEALEMFYFSQDLGTGARVNMLDRLVFDRAARSPDVLPRFAAALDKRLSPYDIVPPSTLLQWVTAAVTRGEWMLVPTLVMQLPRRPRVRLELAMRTLLLENAARRARLA